MPNEIDYRQHHFLEPRASLEVTELIDSRSRAVWDACTSPGADGALNCLSVRNYWLMEFERAGVACEPHGRGADITVGCEGGGYREDGAMRDHHFLVVGRERALFDPTAGQFGEPGSARLEDYFVLDLLRRREVCFLEWREFPEVVERFMATR